MEAVSNQSESFNEWSGACQLALLNLVCYYLLLASICGVACGSEYLQHPRFFFCQTKPAGPHWNRSKYSESICIENVIFLTTLDLIVRREWSHSPVAMTMKSRYPLCLSLDLRKGKSFSSDYIRCREVCRRFKGLNAPMSQHKDNIPSSSTVSVWH